jgi:CRISPR/Cas system-associated protein Cas10 (large subunit of type III CRISPR-Cas system)
MKPMCTLGTSVDLDTAKAVEAAAKQANLSISSWMRAVIRKELGLEPEQAKLKEEKPDTCPYCHDKLSAKETGKLKLGANKSLEVHLECYTAAHYELPA